MILGVGETVLDIIFRSSQPLAAIPAGSAFNAIISLGRYFHGREDVAMLCQVGDDRVGRLTRDYLRANHVSDRFVTTAPGMKSHLSLAFLNRDNDAEYSFYKDHLAWSSLDDLLRQGLVLPTFSADDVLLLSSFFAVNPHTWPLVSRILDDAKRAGAFIYYDINFRPAHARDLDLVRDHIRTIASLASVVRASDEDLTTIGFTPACRNLIITRGAGQVEVRVPGLPARLYDVPTIDTVSTVGAGDNFNAGYIAGYITTSVDHHRASAPSSADNKEDESIRLALRFAQNVCRQLANSIDLSTLTP